MHVTQYKYRVVVVVVGGGGGGGGVVFLLVCHTCSTPGPCSPAVMAVELASDTRVTVVFFANTVRRSNKQTTNKRSHSSQ